MKLLFVHGWSVTNTDTYGELPEVVREQARTAGMDIATTDVFLGRYISFYDEVRMDDLVRAFDRGVRDALGVVGTSPLDAIPPFACVTHSTGGPLALCWLDRYYGAAGLVQSPLQHLIMLAPASHGSALAQLGKAKVGRLKAWFSGVEPGQQILDWLELGSNGQRALHTDLLAYNLAASHAAGGHFFPFVFTGETIDRALYDFINSYTGEPGSDGVVRVAAANLNARWLTLTQTNDPVGGTRSGTTAITGSTTVISKNADIITTFARGDIRRAPPTVMRVVPGASHSGVKLGIMRSITPDNAAQKPLAQLLLDALSIDDGDAYAAYVEEDDQANAAVQEAEPSGRYFMFIFRVNDDQGYPINDYDLILLGGEKYDPNALPPGFFRDRQKNSLNANTLTYYLNYDALSQIPEKKIGFRIIARPDQGFAWYEPAEFRSDTLTLDQICAPNVTTYVDIIMKRRVDREAVRFDLIKNSPGSFKGTKPTGDEV